MIQSVVRKARCVVRRMRERSPRQLEARLAQLKISSTQLEARSSQLEAHTAELETHAIELEARFSQLEARSSQLEAHTAGLETHATKLEARSIQLEIHATKLGARSAQLETHSEELKVRSTQLETHSEELEARLTTRLTALEAQWAKIKVRVDNHEAQIFYRTMTHDEEIQEIKTISMLHPEILALLRSWASMCQGAIVEIGAYVGGATVAIAKGVQQSGGASFISMEMGGAHDHPSIPSKDIIGDLRANLARFNVGDCVTILEGASSQPEIVQQAKRLLQDKQIELLVLDADGRVEDDLKNYLRMCKPGCIVVIDDYVTSLAGEKMDLTKPIVDTMVEEKILHPIGVFGYGTWIGTVKYTADIPVTPAISEVASS